MWHFLTSLQKQCEYFKQCIKATVVVYFVLTEEKNCRHSYHPASLEMLDKY